MVDAHPPLQRASCWPRRGDWAFESEPGLLVGEKVTPIARPGCSARAARPATRACSSSSARRLSSPACPTIAVVVPPKPGAARRVDPVVLVVADKLGIDEVFRVNGPAGVAALGFGTETIPKVREGGRAR